MTNYNLEEHIVSAQLSMKNMKNLTLTQEQWNHIVGHLSAAYKIIQNDRELLTHIRNDCCNAKEIAEYASLPSPCEDNTEKEAAMLHKICMRMGALCKCKECIEKIDKTDHCECISDEEYLKAVKEGRGFICKCEYWGSRSSEVDGRFHKVYDIHKTCVEQNRDMYLKKNGVLIARIGEVGREIKDFMTGKFYCISEDGNRFDLIPGDDYSFHAGDKNDNK